jgi:hypothetical protein
LKAQISKPAGARALKLKIGGGLMAAIFGNKRLKVIFTTTRTAPGRDFAG